MKRKCQADLFPIYIFIDLSRDLFITDRSGYHDRLDFTLCLRLRLRHSNAVFQVGSATIGAALGSGSPEHDNVRLCSEAIWAYEEEPSLDTFISCVYPTQSVRTSPPMTLNFVHIAPSPFSLSSRLDIPALISLRLPCLNAAFLCLSSLCSLLFCGPQEVP